MATMRPIRSESASVGGQPQLTVPTELDVFLQASAEHHGHLCPRQVLGVRMGILAGSLLGMALPQQGNRRTRHR